MQWHSWELVHRYEYGGLALDAIATSDKTIEVFGLSGSRLVKAEYDGTGWSPWLCIDEYGYPDITYDYIKCVNLMDGRIMVALVRKGPGPTGLRPVQLVYYVVMAGRTRASSGPIVIGDSPHGIQTPPHIANATIGECDLIIRSIDSPDGGWWYRRFKGEAWGDWQKFNDGSRPLILTKDTPNRSIGIFKRWSNSKEKLYRTLSRGTWSEPQPCTGLDIDGEGYMTGASPQEGVVELFRTSFYNELPLPSGEHRIMWCTFNNGVVSNWQLLEGVHMVNPAAISQSPGKVDVFAMALVQDAVAEEVWKKSYF